MFEILSYVVHRAQARQRWRRWKTLRAPFVHSGERGLKFRLYPPELIDGYIYAEGIYERRLLHFLRKRLRGRTMLDIGANIGNHAIFLADRFDAVHCFEPNPVTVERLRENIALNGLSISTHPVALGDARENLPFRSNITGNLGGGSFVRQQFPVSNTLPVYPGDDYLRGVGVRDVDFIKLDVEGFEMKVLRGLSETIARDRPIICLEYDEDLNGGVFDELEAALPGYIFADAIRPSPRRDLLGRLQFVLRNGLEPPLHPLDRLSGFHEAVIAFPSRGALEAF